MIFGTYEITGYEGKVQCNVRDKIVGKTSERGKIITLLTISVCSHGHTVKSYQTRTIHEVDI